MNMIKMVNVLNVHQNISCQNFNINVLPNSQDAFMMTKISAQNVFLHSCLSLDKTNAIFQVVLSIT
jgi:hypothetical protein